MNLVKRAAVQMRTQPVGAGMSLTDMDNMMYWSAFGQPTYTGKSVSQLSSLQMSAVWACVNVLSGDLATLPLQPFRHTEVRLASGRLARELATEHYLYPLLKHQANPEMTSWRFKQLMQAWLLLWGNAYAEIEISGRGQVTALWPWRPDRVKVERPSINGPLTYTYRMADGKYVTVPHERMLHLRGLGIDGMLGLSPIDMHRQAIGLGLAVQEHGARFFGNGARPLGVLRTPGRLKAAGGVEEVREAWEAVHGGLQNAHRVAILQEGMDYKEIGISPVNAQYMETMHFSITDIARIFNVPPHRIADLTRSTNNNIEQEALEYVLYGLGPWCSNWQNELVFSLLSPRESESIFVEFDFHALLRGDLEAQSKFYPAMVNAGILDPDEAREELGRNPFPNGWGARPLKPLNVGYAGDPTPVAPPESAIFTPPKQKLNGKEVTQ